MEEASGKDLAWFFDQWVYGIGSPKLDIRQFYSRRTQTLTLTIRQTQLAGALTPVAFQLPLNVTIKTKGKEIDQTFDIKKRVETFEIKTERPTEIDIDPELRIPLKTVKLRPLVTSR